LKLFEIDGEVVVFSPSFLYLFILIADKLSNN